MTAPTPADLELFHRFIRKNVNVQGCWVMRMYPRIPLERGGEATAFRFALYTGGHIEEFDQPYHVRSWSCRHVLRSYPCINPAHADMKHLRPCSADRIQSIRADFRRGIHIRDIAKTHEVTITKIMTYTRGIKSKQVRVSEMNQQVAALMWINGRDVPTIAKHLGVHRVTVYQMLRRSGEFLSEAEFEESRCNPEK